MDKSLITSFTLLLTAILAGCSGYEEPPCKDAETETVTIPLTVEKPMTLAGSSTRSLDSGEIYCIVYSKDSSHTQTYNIQLSDGKGEFSLQLPKNEKFDIYFLLSEYGSSIVNQNMPLQYVTADKILKINYSSPSYSDAALDFCYASLKNFSTGTVLAEPIRLTRPFAQLNIGTKKFSSYNAAYPIKDVSVTVDGVYTQFNLATGTASGTAQKITFGASARPSLTFPVSGADYLAVKYLLVDQPKSVNLSFTINHTDASRGPITLNKNSIPLEANHQTNIIVKDLFDY